MKNSNTNKIGSAQRFTHWAAVLTLAASLVIMALFTACPNAAGGGGTSSGGNTGGGSSTSQSKYTVNFGVDGANGTLTAKVDGTAISSGAQVEKGKTVTFTATPAAGYRVKGWTLDGTAVNGTNSTYSLTVSKAAAVKVSFESNAVPLPKYAVTFGVDGANGTLTAKVDGAAINSGAQVEKGKTVTFTATPAEGYRITGWSRNGSYLPIAGNTYSEPITSDVTVTVAFELDVPNYTVNFGTEGGNGTLTALGPNAQPITTGTEIAKGKKVYFTAEPAPGFMTGSWTIEGGSFEAGTGTPENPLATVTVSAPLTVKVSFKPADSIPLSKLDIEGTILKGYTGEKPRGILRVPAHITEIADYAFMECTGITEVHLPESLTHIGEFVFWNCNNLEGRLEFPENLSLIDKGAFKDCDKLTALDFSKCTQPLTIGDLVFTSCYKISGSIKFPAKLTSLGKDAFKSCLEVENFDFRLCSNPPLTAIGTDAFNYTDGRFKVKTGSRIKALLTASGVDAGKIDEES
ncbi:MULTISPECIES: leucine-rich repeat protein [unclassified Treponema]|uniref:leucine-rich repeat protein n=1 Tax=unclassified Treponema TaxID=2638727 RepID=UPI0020A26629|nr:MULTISPECIES: leucine-rich repeat protein [unclassified Treponema]UTC66535.1 leucine-rich repeat protein [Treponema sp. OMZ 789]UTC69267.1 leucine-rich repeat protein [Treponema sp. OMZ 790]UTC71980.1 leucine-rich repeat protein [Treponema sp. OMZ 791]